MLICPGLRAGCLLGDKIRIYEALDEAGVNPLGEENVTFSERITNAACRGILARDLSGIG